MRKIALATMAVAATAALVLSGCSQRNDAGTDTEDGGGFAADSLIGVALPDATSENWKIAIDQFDTALTEAGFESTVVGAAATNTVADQQAQIESMITSGAKVIVIGAKDAKQLGTQLQAAADEGITIIAYDRLLEGSENVGYYVAFDNFKVGELQGQALLDGLAEKFPDKTAYNVELFSGDPGDPNAAVFFDGAMSILQPKIDDGTLTVVSGQTSVEQTATTDWAAENAQTRMDTLLIDYAGLELDGVLAPNDNLARAVLQSVADDGRPGIVVTGQDSETASIPLIMSGEQYMTIYKDTRALIAQTVAMIEALAAGDTPETTTEENNESIEVPTYYLDPVVVTAKNAKEAYADNPELLALTQ